MKRLILYLAIIVTASLFIPSCVIETDDDDWRDDHWHDYDYSLYDYLEYGRWYPESPSGLTDCEYHSYTTYRNDRVKMYDCDGYIVDGGRYRCDYDYIYITYDNGDKERFYVAKAASDRLVIEDDYGKRYYYVRD